MQTKRKILNEMKTKEQVRSRMRIERSKLSEAECQEKSKAIIEKLLSNPVIGTAEKILLYASVKNEVSTVELFERLILMGKSVYFPRTDELDMDFYCVHKLQELKEGMYGIPEPQGNEAYNYDKAVMIVPGLAFSKRGYRIGYGKGYYDRYLMKHNTNNLIYTVGIAYDFQLLSEQWTYDDYDIAVNTVITD